jgi:hypothetical protein
MTTEKYIGPLTIVVILLVPIIFGVCGCETQKMMGKVTEGPTPTPTPSSKWGPGKVTEKTLNPH